MHTELMQNAKKFVAFWFLYAVLIWLILFVASALGDQVV